MCGGTVKVCNRQPAPASKWRGTKCNNLGDMQTQEISLIDDHDASKGLRLVYRDGDICKKQVSGQMEIGSRQVTYEIECDRGSDSGVLQRIVETSVRAMRSRIWMVEKRGVERVCSSVMSLARTCAYRPPSAPPTRSSSCPRRSGTKR